MNESLYCNASLNTYLIQVQAEFAKSSGMTLIEVDPESKIIELKAEDILENDGGDNNSNDVDDLENEKDDDSEEEELNFEGLFRKSRKVQILKNGVKPGVGNYFYPRAPYCVIVCVSRAGFQSKGLILG
jgi:hypothetical protein